MISQMAQYDDLLPVITQVSGIDKMQLGGYEERAAYDDDSNRELRDNQSFPHPVSLCLLLRYSFQYIYRS